MNAHEFYIQGQYLPDILKFSSYIIAAFVIFMYSIIERITSGMRSAGGMIWMRYFFFFSLISRHCRKSPSWPNEALTVGKPRAEVSDFTVSDATPDMVVSKIICGGWLLRIKSVYREQTENFPQLKPHAQFDNPYAILIHTVFQKFSRVRSIALHCG